MGLGRLIIRRIILAVPAAISAMTLIFAVILMLSPVMRVAIFIQSPRDLNPENLQRLIHTAGLDQPIPVQYANWLAKVVRLDFGRSLSSEAPAMSMVLASVPATLELLLYSMPLIIFFGVWLGTKAAINHNKKVDHVARLVGTMGASFPVFLLAEVLIMACVAAFKFYPGGILDDSVRADLNLRIGRGTFSQFTGMYTIDALLNGDIPLFLNAIKHLVFPVGLLVFTQTAALMKVTRSDLIEESGKTYIRAAMTKGLSKKETIYKHARKNASVSVLTLSGLLLGNMLLGLVIVETSFGIPGFAHLTAYSARILDTPVLFAATTIVAMVYVIMNLVVDLLYVYMDPRIKL